MKSKVVTIKGETFVRGKAKCVECGKAVKYLLTSPIALMLPEHAILCRKDFWEDMGAPDDTKLMFRELL